MFNDYIETLVLEQIWSKKKRFLIYHFAKKFKNPRYRVTKSNLRIGKKCSTRDNCRSNICLPDCPFGSGENEKYVNVYDDFVNKYSKSWNGHERYYSGAMNRQKMLNEIHNSKA